MSVCGSASYQDDTQAELRQQLANWAWPGLVALGVLLIFATEVWRWTWKVDALALLLAGIALLTWLLLSRAYLISAWLLVLGSAGLAILSMYWLPGTAGYCLLALPAALAVLLISIQSGLGIATFSSLAIIFASRWGTLPTITRVPALIVVWGATGLLSAAVRVWSQPIESLWKSYSRMHELLEQARDQRLELKQVQADLVQANAELARLSERLSRMYQVAEEARRAKEEFVANVSHELRTPLNMIIGFSEMISGASDAYGIELPPSLLADVDVILRNSRHLAELVDDVLDLSQVEAGQMSLTREWSSLPETIEQALVAVRPLYEAKGLALTVDIPLDLPLLHIDRTRIRQVLLNLVSNAGRFTTHGGVQVKVQREGNQVVVSVIDTGPGIAPEHQERIFGPFQQVDTPIHRRFGGTGLGLTISKRFVEMHSGKMWLESELGKGSTFHFSLPLQQDLPEPGASAVRWLSVYHQENPRLRPSKAPKPKLLPRFVVLERGNVLQRLFTRYLQDIQIAGVETFEEAIAELNRSPAQALIINDPAIEQLGPNLIGQSAHLPFGTPAIACWVPGEEEAAARLGVMRYLLKPISREDLEAVLESLGNGAKTILLADDDTEMQQLLGRMLASTDKGHRLLRAPNGQRALSLLRERKPDLMLLDLVMPGMDGYAVLREKSLDVTIRDIPVVVVSARDPVRESIISNSLTLVRAGGLTLHDLLTCLRTWGEVMGPATPDGPASQGRPDG